MKIKSLPDNVISKRIIFKQLFSDSISIAFNHFQTCQIAIKIISRIIFELRSFPVSTTSYVLYKLYDTNLFKFDLYLEHIRRVSTDALDGMPEFRSKMFEGARKNLPFLRFRFILSSFSVKNWSK